MWALRSYKPWSALLVLAVCILLSVMYHDLRLLWLPAAGMLMGLLVRWGINKTESLFWLLFITLPLSTEVNITASLGLDLPDELCMLALTAMAILYWIYAPRAFPRVVWQHPLFALLLLHLLWITVATFFSTTPLLSVKFLLAKTWFIIPFVILPAVWIHRVKDAARLARCLLYPMLAVVIITLIRHASTDLRFETVNKHLFPFFRNHVNYASMLVCLLVVGIGMYRLTPQEHPHRKWILVGLILGLAALVFAYSRGAWLALLVGACVVPLMRKKWMGGAIFLSVLLVMASVCWLVTDKQYFRFAPDHDRTIFHTDFGAHMNATISFKDVSNAERFHRWVAGARMLAERPMTGFGPSSFYSQYQPYTVNSFRTWVSNNPEHSTVHNYFLLTALEQGLPGLCIFLGLYVCMLLRLQYLYHQLHNRFWQTTAMVTAVILVMIGVINFMSDMIETDKIGSLFWLSLGMIMVLERKLKEELESIA